MDNNFLVHHPSWHTEDPSESAPLFYSYLQHTFTKLPKAQTLEPIEALLPSDIEMDQRGIR